MASLKICTLKCYFCWMYIMFEPKKYRGVMYDNTEEWCKIWGGNELLWKMTWVIWRTLTQHWKISKFALLMGSFRPTYTMFEVKSTEELCVIILKIDANSEGKMTYAFINDMRNLANFTEALKIFKFALWETFFSKIYNVWAKKLQRSYVLWHWRVMKYLKKLVEGTLCKKNLSQWSWMKFIL